MIVVTGATGKLGSQIVHQLLDRGADDVGVSVRDPARAADLSALGVRVRHGDFADPASLIEAFEGATKVLIVSAGAHGDAAIAQNRAAIDAACAAGAERIFYTSHQGANAQSHFGPMRVHAATEQHLAATGRPFTALRHGFYASTIPLLVGSALETGRIVAPADGPVSWTTHADLAAAAAILLTATVHFDGPTPPLTAPDAVDLDQIARTLSDISGRTIQRIVAADDEWVAGLVDHGTPATQATAMLDLYRAMRDREFSATDPTLERLLERPASPVRSTIEGIATPP